MERCSTLKSNFDLKSYLSNGSPIVIFFVSAITLEKIKLKLSPISPTNTRKGQFLHEGDYSSYYSNSESPLPSSYFIITKNVLVNKLLIDGLLDKEQNEPGSTLPSSSAKTYFSMNSS